MWGRSSSLSLQRFCNCLFTEQSRCRYLTRMKLITNPRTCSRKQYCFWYVNCCWSTRLKISAWLISCSQLPSGTERDLSGSVWRLSQGDAVFLHSHRKVRSRFQAIGCRRSQLAPDAWRFLLSCRIHWLTNVYWLTNTDAVNRSFCITHLLQEFWVTLPHIGIENVIFTSLSLVFCLACHTERSSIVWLYTEWTLSNLEQCVTDFRQLDVF